MATIIVESDYHSGHIAGLTPPSYWTGSGPWRKVQMELWRKRQAIIEEVGRPDLLILNGDLLDGKGTRSGGTEELTTAMITQARMATECAMQWEAPHVAISRGTDYHVGWGGEDWEDDVAERVLTATRNIHGKDAQVEIEDQLFIRHEGITIDAKHHSGSTSIPHGGGTAILKDKVWNEQWWLDGQGQPLADIILRSHCHWHEGYWGFRSGKVWYAIRTPALQAKGTKFGKKCSHRVDWGLIRIEVEDGKILDVVPYIVAIKANKSKVVRM